MHLFIIFIICSLYVFLSCQVNVFGYGADSDGNWSHYWEILTNKGLRTGVHPGSYEYNIIQQLDQQQKIKFYEGLTKKM